MPLQISLSKPSAGTAVTIAFGTSLAEADRQLILATLEQCGGVKTRAAEILGISLKTLYNRLVEYGEDASKRPRSANSATRTPETACRKGRPAREKSQRALRQAPAGWPRSTPAPCKARAFFVGSPADRADNEIEETQGRPGGNGVRGHGPC